MNTSTLPRRGWARAIALAGSAMPADEWRHELALAVREACGVLAVHTAVFTCPPGDWHALRITAYPDEHSAAMPELVRYLPRIDRAGSWQAVLARQGLVSTPIDLGLDRDLTDEIYRQALHPRGVRGMVVAYCLDGGGELIANISVSVPVAAPPVLDRLRAPLERVALTASRTLRAAQSLAAACSPPAAKAVPPVRPATGPSRPAAALTPRERQVFELLLDGLADLNLGARLGISEETVGTHVSRIFRKLGVHTRAELIATYRGHHTNA